MVTVPELPWESTKEKIVKEKSNYKESKSAHVWMPNAFQPEENPLDFRAVMSSQIKDKEYDEMLNHYLEKHPEKTPTDEYDQFEAAKKKRLYGNR